jgi:hypothetical protein
MDVVNNVDTRCKRGGVGTYPSCRREFWCGRYRNDRNGAMHLLKFYLHYNIFLPCACRAQCFAVLFWS